MVDSFFILYLLFILFIIVFVYFCRPFHSISHIKNIFIICELWKKKPFRRIFYVSKKKFLA